MASHRSIIHHILVVSMAGVLLVLVGWLAWFYVSPTVMLHWPSPGSPTAYAQWEKRPTVVKENVRRSVLLTPQRSYAFRLRLPPGQFHRADLVMTATRYPADLMVTVDGRATTQQYLTPTSTQWSFIGPLSGDLHVEVGQTTNPLHIQSITIRLWRS